MSRLADRLLLLTAPRSPEEEAFLAAADAIGDDLGELVSTDGNGKPYLQGGEITVALYTRLTLVYATWRALQAAKREARE